MKGNTRNNRSMPCKERSVSVDRRNGKMLLRFRELQSGKWDNSRGSYHRHGGEKQ